MSYIDCPHCHTDISIDVLMISEGYKLHCQNCNFKIIINFKAIEPDPIYEDYKRKLDEWIAKYMPSPKHIVDYCRDT
jgi:DNA-directed RNA polymerase subunit RPC12/RpoP